VKPATAPKPAVAAAQNATPAAPASRLAPLGPVTVGPVPVASAAPTTVVAKVVAKAEITKPSLILDPALAGRASADSSDR
jgi:hypothetical protein